MTGATRICVICKRPKPVEDFYVRGRGGKKPMTMDRCKACHIERVRRRKAERLVEIEMRARRKMTDIPKMHSVPNPEQLRVATIKEACRYGKFSITKCYQMINAKRIKAYKLDKRTLVDLDSVDALIRSVDAAEAFKVAKPIL